jgi:hypothetical protein
MLFQLVSEQISSDRDAFTAAVACPTDKATALRFYRLIKKTDLFAAEA